MKKLKVALVIDWLTEVGGAEQVLLELHRLYPDAPIYTSQYREERIDWFKDADVQTGYLDAFPAKFRRLIAPLRQRYFKNLDLKGYDLVISITGSDAKFVKTDGVHLCYCHVPTQYYWGKYEEYLKNPGFKGFNPLVRAVFKRLAPKLKQNDLKASENPTKYLTISKFAKSEIKTYYKRESKVISPPVNTEFFAQYVDNYNRKVGKSQIKEIVNNTIKITKKQMLGLSYENIKIKENQGLKSEQKFYTNLKNVDNLSIVAEVLTRFPNGFYLNFSRQVSWKNLNLLIKTFKKLDLPLVLIGNGPENRKLKKLAGDSKNILFLEPLKKQDLAFLSSLANAFIFPSEEPFGIAPVEAMSAGCPVIALKKGGALDYIKENVNGFFFDEPTEKSLEKTLKKFEKRTVPLDSKKISKSVEKFSRENFVKKIKKEINSLKLPLKKPRLETEKTIKIGSLGLRSFLFMTFPAVLFFSNFPKFILGETSSMYLELTLPLIWLGFFALLSLKPVLKYLKENLKTPLLFAPLFLVLTLLWSSDKLRGILTVGVVLCLFISILGIKDLVRNATLIKNTKKIFLFTTALVCLFCIVQVFLDAIGADKSLTLLCENCVSKTFGFAHPNGFSPEPQFMGSLLLAPIFLSLNSLLKNKNRKSQINYLLVAILSLTTLFLTLSRGAIFAFLLGAFILLIHFRKSLKSLIKLLVLIFFTFIFSLNLQGILSTIGPTDANYVTGINRALSQLTFDKLGHTEPLKKKSQEVEPAEDNSPDFNGYVEESTNRRLELAEFALKISTENPTNLLFGTGVGSAGTELYRHFPEKQGHKKEIVQNEYLETLLETGLFGIFALIMSIITFFKLEKIKFNAFSLALFVAFLFQLIFFSGLPNALHVYLLPMIYLIYDQNSFSRTRKRNN
ncbi:glycosyltransferase [Candidatus Saccharibacteria bacterium]|nr:glycosyltransferase [Candidatus Saccharibacteria bacterium]